MMAVATVKGDEPVKEALNISNRAPEKACLMAFTKDIQAVQCRWASYETIKCTAYFQCSSCKTWCYKGKCNVYCGHWHLLQFKQQELADLAQNKEKASINLMDHFSELVPNFTNGKVGLVTYQNGINNTYADDFAEMGETIKSLLPEGPLCIGIYNQSSTIVPDLARLQCEFYGVRTEVVRSNRKMFTTLTNRLRALHTHPMWLHICHSEGGLIAHDTLAGLEYSSSIFCHNHLLVHTFGSVQPIPKKAAKEALNTYSTHDIAYRMYGVKYENRSDYEIKIVTSKTKPFSPIPGDHGFLGSTYPSALENNINDLRDRHKIYDAKK